MNKLLKGAIAGAAGVALLLGGAGTFALWNDATNIGNNDTITAGRLQFGDTTGVDGVWTLNGAPVTLSTARIVPGDELVYTADDVPIIVEGATQTAKLGVDWLGLTEGDAAAASTELLNALGDPAITVNGAPGDTVTIPGTLTDGGQQTIDVAVHFVFDDGTDGTTAQAGVVNLDGFQLTLTQVLAS